ncbi:Uncharacterized protein BM_BM13606 [Brugia malayi]|uniref:Uncharacterized protein n=1 Tax=Brugia malayi TaxID=6279 RepID=A0A4E9FG68_BRUMA|nr:Uncharacterized protein BM_BM13606 [Brugia malayi]VIO95219.1 Uncharacterized protein BM_BM13606 [Brugia malayi]
MSAVASSSTTVVDNNSNSSIICNNPPKRRNGTFRVLAEDYSQFTLGDEFDNDFHQILTDCEPYTLKFESILDDPLIDRFNNKKLNKNTLKESYMSHHQKEISRLTDEVEIDGDSASDELDLLPPLPPSSGTGRKFPKWKIKLPNWLLCRNPRVPIKCIIM